MIEKWLHIEYLSKDKWVLPLITALNRGISKGKYKKLPPYINELALHVTTRLEALYFVRKRINKELEMLYKEIKTHTLQHEYTRKQKGKTFRLNDDLKYNLIVDIDAFLFETKSCGDQIITFFKAIYKHIGIELKTKEVRERCKDIIDNRIGCDWMKALVSHRNFFIHEGTPYVAVDITNPSEPSLIIMKKNLKKFDSSRHFITISEVNDIVQGFYDSLPLLQNDILSIITGIK
jgi:hypothetical protein